MILKVGVTRGQHGDLDKLGYGQGKILKNIFKHPRYYLLNNCQTLFVSHFESAQCPCMQIHTHVEDLPLLERSVLAEMPFVPIG